MLVVAVVYLFIRLNRIPGRPGATSTDYFDDVDYVEDEDKDNNSRFTPISDSKHLLGIAE